MLDIKLNKKSISYIKIAVVLLLVVLAVFFVFLPGLNSAKDIKVKIHTLESNMTVAENLLKSVGGIEEEKLLSQKDVSLILDKIISLSNENNVKIIIIDPKEVNVMEEYSCIVYPIELELEVDYMSLGGFLSGLENIEESIVKVKSFSVKRDEDISPQAKVKIDLEIYLRAD